MYVRELTVLPSDASCHGELKLHGLLNHLQDTASLAATGLEGGPTQVLARGYAWVLLRYEVELLRRLPEMDERFVIKTFHDMNHGYHTLRVFQVETPSGVPLVWAKTSWLLLDLAAKGNAELAALQARALAGPAGGVASSHSGGRHAHHGGYEHDRAGEGRDEDGSPGYVDQWRDDAGPGDDPDGCGRCQGHGGARWETRHDGDEQARCEEERRSRQDLRNE